MKHQTPGPHRLQPKGLRQEVKDFQEKVRQQTTDDPTPLNSTDPGLLFIKTLAKAISDNHHHDLNEPIKFTGQDQHWNEFYYQLRSYLAAKNWLSTFDHPHGPGHLGFDNDVNLKIFNKLTSLCHKGTAITYIRMAAEFDGWGAGRTLRSVRCVITGFPNNGIAHYVTQLRISNTYMAPTYARISISSKNYAHRCLSTIPTILLVRNKRLTGS